MHVKYVLKLNRSLKIQLDGDYLLLYFKYNRFILSNKKIGNVDTDELLSDKILNQEEILLQLIHLFKHDLSILENIMREKRLKEVFISYISELAPGWKLYLNDYSYRKSKNLKIRLYINRDKYNKEAVKFLVSRYYTYFENKFMIKEKKEYIERIAYIHNTYETLTQVLCSIQKDFEFEVKDISNVELVKFLKAYAIKLYL